MMKQLFPFLFLIFSFIISKTHSQKFFVRRYLLSTSSIDKAKLRLSDLEYHNYYRIKHSTCKLNLNKSLNKMAQLYAEELAKNNSGLEHSKGRKNIGENLYMGGGYTQNGTVSYNASQTLLYYSESKGYNYSFEGFSTGTGHFTQLVWNKTTDVGFGYAIAGAKEDSDVTTYTLYCVSNYWPGGNVLTQFTKNVFPYNESLNEQPEYCNKEISIDTEDGIVIDVDTDTDEKNSGSSTGMSGVGKFFLVLGIIIVIIGILICVDIFLLKGMMFKKIKGLKKKSKISLI